MTSHDPVHPTTTHSTWGAGRPRLLVSGPNERFEFELSADIVKIGTAPDAELNLAGTKALHAEVRHEADDEYVLFVHGSAETEVEPIPLSPGDDGAVVLRTGSHFAFGDWSLVFQRDEFADHGRPYGGREGGESDVQRKQPPRPDYRKQ
ncbi:FHA domain-containing protein [Humibacter sp. RRB41]|uniref:FHA domain-containing protein n=1 Tax=Humibacter sp. RRB41 TaxID=2919946 RepID=UPI001FA9C48D|nr:FHA domain-containing protein [Humibacter sp. RRB41]